MNYVFILYCGYIGILYNHAYNGCSARDEILTSAQILVS